MSTPFAELDTTFWNLETPTTRQQFAGFFELDTTPDYKTLCAIVEKNPSSISQTNLARFKHHAAMLGCR